MVKLTSSSGSNSSAKALIRTSGAFRVPKWNTEIKLNPFNVDDLTDIAGDLKIGKM